MIFVAVVALILITIKWLGQVEGIFPDFVFAQVEIGGYVFPHTSPFFWIILTLTLAVNLALVVGAIRLIIWAVRAFNRRRDCNR